MFKRYAFLIALATLFALPGLFAILFYTHPHWLVWGTTNRGQLINPPLRWENFPTHGKWQLIYWSPKTCKLQCVRQLDKMARIRLALGRHLREVEQTLALKNMAFQALSNRLDSFLRERDIHLRPLSDEEISNLLEKKAKFLIMSPNHYVVLAYATTAKPEDIYQDLKHLLSIE